ncbi:polyketide synthase [Chlorella sorokiniana]|uniref:Polyketide synthase n=1 Tax=Chlorella sorokiniana TaxID=3076 RepID=A0A2P6TZY9_CHLSO|nr:polyketide synthase [Chlorella sorokiniana]|eukprot:PRW59632.1 polyketide synthase [Chlorella sorokiniana]
MPGSQLARGLAAAQPHSRAGGAARRRPLVAVSQAVQAAPQRSSELWRSQQSRRLLLLHAHEQRVAAKGQVAAVAPQQLVASQLQLAGPAAEQIGAMLARLEGDGFISQANGATNGRSSNGSTNSKHMNGSLNGTHLDGSVNGKATNGSSHSHSHASSSEAAPNGSRAAATASSSARQAPQLPKPWKQMTTDERRTYLMAVQSFYGEGVMYERRLPSGRVLLALVDPRMKSQLSEHVWKERPRGGRCGLFTDTGPQPGRWYLARWTAEQCLLPTGGKLPLHVAGWRHKDGCPSNCLARNLEVELAPMAGRQAALAATGGNQEAPAAPAVAQRRDGSRQARQLARQAVQQLYESVGAGEARRFLQSLHREMLVAAPAR